MVVVVVLYCFFIIAGHCALVQCMVDHEQHKHKDSRWAERALGCAAFRGHKQVVSSGSSSSNLCTHI